MTWHGPGAGTQPGLTCAPGLRECAPPLLSPCLYRSIVGYILEVMRESVHPLGIHLKATLQRHSLHTSIPQFDNICILTSVADKSYERSCREFRYLVTCVRETFSQHIGACIRHVHVHAFQGFRRCAYGTCECAHHVHTTKTKKRPHNPDAYVSARVSAYVSRVSAHVSALDTRVRSAWIPCISRVDKNKWHGMTCHATHTRFVCPCAGQGRAPTSL